jgi:hypothetical protein
MWMWLLFYRRGFVRLMAIIVMIAVGSCLSLLDFDWYVWAPAGAVSYLILPIVWGLFVCTLDKRKYEEEIRRISRELVRYGIQP